MVDCGDNGVVDFDVVEWFFVVVECDDGFGVGVVD